MRTLNKISSICFLGVLSVGLLSSIAYSEEPPTRGPIPFSAYDENDDGYISQEEFDAVRQQRMETKAAEGRPMAGAANAPSFSDFDADGDGHLTPAELSAGQRGQMSKPTGMGMNKNMGMGRNMPEFSEYDLDGDGKILQKEFDEARSQRIGDRAEEGYKMKNVGKAPAFSDIDTDGDGEITAEEFAKHQSMRRQ